MHSSGIKKSSGGSILVTMVVFASLAVLLMTALSVGVAASIKASRRSVTREQSIQIAEAGVDYYRWHLAHAQADYKDGTATSGPYVHSFYDKTGTKIGSYSLTITPPASGSTIVTIQSKGSVDADPGAARTLAVQVAIPSLAKYAVVANDTMRFGSGTEVFGPIQSNGGIHFDGIAHNIISSSQSTYVDPDDGSTEYGVYTAVSPADPHPPAAYSAHADVFQSGRQFPVPTVDFAGLTSDLSALKSQAQSGGAYYSSSGSLGYHIVLQTNDTFKLYKVTSLSNVNGGCTNNSNPSPGVSGWGSWSIQNQTLLGTYAFPANGIVFVEDNVWVDGQISTARLTIASGKFPDNPSTRTSITVNTNLKYTNYDGRDVLALIAQNNFNVGLVSDDSFEIDGAIVAQNGRAGRYYYASQCGSQYVRSTLTLYGMIATNQRYGFAYTDGTGYTTRVLNYDANLLYGPPPSFPVTGNQYSIISWKEI